jgi:signal transduction histidine kinase
MIRDLRPVMLDTLGLEGSLAELVEGWESHQSGTCCRLEVRKDLGELDESLAITIYRIIQEALTNVANHADASRVEIEIRRTPGTGAVAPSVLVTVADNGKGIMSGADKEGMGLLGLRERVLSASGTFELETGPGRGVRIKVRLPIRPESVASQMRRDPV